MGSDEAHKTTLGVSAIVIELLKIISLVTANTFLYMAHQIKKKNLRAFKDGSVKDINTITDDKLFLDMVLYKDMFRSAVLSFVFYGVCSLVTTTSVMGFILESVESGKSLAVSTEITIDDQITLVNETIVGRKDTIGANKEIIANNKDIVSNKKSELSSLDKTSDTYAKDKARLEREIRSLLDINTKISTTNTELLNLNTQDLTKMASKAVTVKAEKKQEAKDMYTLMSEAINVSASTLRFVLLALMAVILEIGLFFTSPHMNKMEEEESEEKKEEITTPETASIKEEIAEKSMVPSGKRRGRPAGSKNKPKQASEGTSFAPLEVVGTKDPVPTESELNPLHSVLVEDGIVASSGLVVTVNSPASEPVVETPEATVEPSVIPTVVAEKPSAKERLIGALWDNGGSPYLKELSEAAKEENIPLVNAQGTFEWLQVTKYEKYSLIEFRTTTKKWYPNVTSEIAKKLAKEN